MENTIIPTNLGIERKKTSAEISLAANKILVKL